VVGDRLIVSRPGAVVREHGLFICQQEFAVCVDEVVVVAKHLRVARLDGVGDQQGVLKVADDFSDVRFVFWHRAVETGAYAPAL